MLLYIRVRNFLCIADKVLVYPVLVALKNMAVPILSTEEMNTLVTNISRIKAQGRRVSEEIKQLQLDLLGVTQSEPFIKAIEILKHFKKNTNINGTKRLQSEVDGPGECSTSSELPKRAKYDFTIDDGYVVVFTDGACENNGKKGAKAGIGVWFGDNHPLNVSKPVDGRATNNTAEIQACFTAVQTAIDNGLKKLKIKTDSEFTINCMTQWIHRWKVNNWTLAKGGSVKNKDDLIKLDNACQRLESIKWEHVAGHKGIKGNEEADKLARDGALRYLQ